MVTKTRWAATAVTAMLSGAMTGCAVAEGTIGPLGFGVDAAIWRTGVHYCVPDSVLQEPYFLGERVRNPTGESITLTGIELVNPAGVELVASGVAPVNPDADGFMAGNRDLADPEMPWPQLSPEPLRYTVGAGEEVNLIVQVEGDGLARPASLDRLKLRYRTADNWEYTEFSGTDFTWVPTASC
ncbi:hypothetical protein [Micrococcus sp. TA1]|uniref:hypothetical protein n=1 Tax=Micrococcus sp. TA1 TaxID=681627 RepID=UPI001618E6EB|nr:hypothetical protein [Micrococcus sp. TA1]MBB5748997.1 hypothetical protein [Micrococcus sp. TA1]